MAGNAVNFRLPDPLRVSSNNVADNWRRFHEQWDNYLLAAELANASSERQAVIFLTAISTEA
jgi:hypothetical protein